MKNQKDIFNGYTLTKYGWSVMQNQPEMRPAHIALYFYLVELNNKLRWCHSIGVPTAHTMKMLRLSKPTYLKLISDLQRFGLIHCISKSKNQSTASTFTLRTDAFSAYIEMKTKAHADKEILPA